MIDKSLYLRDINTKGFIMRPAYLHIQEKLGSDICGAEIGIYLGETAEYCLRNLKPRMYYMIDPYDEFGGRSREDWTEIYIWISGIFQNRPNVQFIRDTSENACKMFRDKELDFVYIDANHDYKYVEKDINIWYNKIKKGGVLSGHDFDNPSCPGVRQAVEEFSSKIGKPYFTQKGFECHGGIFDWWIDL
jgi:hypothetical protein